MPAYNTQSPPPSIAPGDSVQVLNGSEVIEGNTPYSSQQVALTGPYGQAGRRLYIEGFASGAPGVFEIDVYESWTDSPNYYQKVQAITVVDANQQFAVDLTDVISGRFVMIQIPTWPNAVTLTALIAQQP